MVDCDQLMPDEDFLEQGSRLQKDLCPAQGMEARTKWFRENLEGFQPYWMDSINGLGNCAYLGEIPSTAVIRSVVVDTTEVSQSMLMMALDPSISLLNFRFCADKYRALTRWFMGYEGVTVTDLIGVAAQLMPDAQSGQ